MKRRQHPGSLYTFKSAYGNETGVLPSRYGESNSFALWVFRPDRIHKGGWVSKKLNARRSRSYYEGQSSAGLVGRMKSLLSVLIRNSLKRGYCVPVCTPEQMVKIWEEQKHKCVACGKTVELVPRATQLTPTKSAHFGHDHETGHPHGFLHWYCNMAEGHMKKMSGEEFENYIQWIRKIHKRGQ